MRTVILGDPPELRTWLERRQALGQDRFDEVWDGDYHVTPAPGGAHGDVDQQVARILGAVCDPVGLWVSGPLNLGVKDNYRVPDRVVLRSRTVEVYVPTAAVAIEIVSPRDESWEKLGFYAAREVDEVVIIDPSTRTVHWFSRDGDRMRPVDGSAVIDLTAVTLAAAIDWPSL